MNTGSAIVAGAGTRDPRAVRKSRWPARLDWMQSASGLVLALFMWGHMFFVSSILLGKDAMWSVTRFFEGYFLLGRSYPWIVSVVVAGVISLLVVHAMLALRKFPIDYRQYRAFRDHAGADEARRHDALVVAGRDRLRDVLPRLDPPARDADAPRADRAVRGADRVWSEHYWPLYLVLLFAVELHGGIGLYRLAVKWGWFAGAHAGRHPAPSEGAEVGDDGLLPRAGARDARGLHQDRHRARAARGEAYTPAWVQPALPAPK